ncbi:MAG: hypothetical protein C0623_08385 [Desulfuromonas sp.]|nr:MAG: hypothetical protein C0623_08385 [Desulfuromonas sp.]
MKLFAGITITALVLLAQPVESRTDDSAALRLIATQGCRGCHVIAGLGGNFGPNLDQVGSRLKRYQIQQKLIDPKTDNPESVMPDIRHLSLEEQIVLSDYLASLK